MKPATPSMIQSLAAVRDAVRDTLRAAVHALAGGGPGAIAAAQDHWHTAHAALQVVDHRGLVKFSAELGALLGAPDSDVKADRAASFAAGCEALIEYMQALIAGRSDQPLRLYPAYEVLQQARGVAQSSRSELFFPELHGAPEDRATVVPLDADELRNTRRALEGGLLPWLRKADSAGLQQIRDAVGRVEGAQQKAGERRLWWVACAVLDALLHGGLPADALARRVLTQLNLHLGRLLQGPADAPEALLRDAMYLAACAKPVTPLVGEVQQKCGLPGALEVEEAAPAGFGGEPLLAARARAHGLQDLWSACAAAAGSAAPFQEFEQRTRALAQDCAALGEPALNDLLMQLADSARVLAAAGGVSGAAHDAAMLEGACALLLVDRVLASDQPPDAGFAERARNLAVRLKTSITAPQALAAVPPAQWLDETAREAQAAEYTALARAEIERDLRDLEPALETWIGNTGNPEPIARLELPLRRVAGAWSVLGHEDAALLARQCAADGARYAQGTACSVDQGRLLVQRIAALAGFADVLRQGPATLEAVAGRLGIDLPQAVAPAAPAPAAVPVVEVQQAAPAMPPTAPPAELPAATVAAAVPPGPVDGTADTDPEMLEIFLEEAGEVLNTIAATAPQSSTKPQDQELLTELRRAFHTLKGSGRMVGLKHLGEAAWEIEQVFNEMSAQQRAGTPDLYRLVEQARVDFTRWIGELRSSKQAIIDAASLTEGARRVRAGEPLPAAAAVVPPTLTLPEIAAPPVAPLAEATLTVTPEAPPAAPPAIEIAAAVTPLAEVPPPAPPPPSDKVMVGDVSVSRALYEIMLPEARQTLEVIAAQNQRVQDGAVVAPDFMRAVHTLSGISGAAKLTPVRALGLSLERILDEAATAGLALQPDARALTARAVNALQQQVADIAELKAPAAHDDLIAALNAVVVAPAAELAPPVQAVVAPVSPALAPPPALPAAEPATAQPAVIPPAAGGPPEAREGERRRYRVNDDIDSQLLPIFLEEAAELVPQVGQDLRAWRARPDDKLVAQSLKRLLHTLKGSARMAGAMALGQLTHSMESRIENAQLLPSLPEQLIDDLENAFDRIGALISQLQQGEPAAGEAEAAPLPAAMEQMSRTLQMATASGAMTQLIPAQFAAEGEAGAGQLPGIPRPLIRVRADLIDRLANQAGEVSIARARISAELRSARGSLRELTENVSRLRAQLRELEIAAETQMQSRFSPTPDQGGGKFDPLEFDRFTRLQELTRLMAESVNDVATVQHSLARDLDEGERALSSQAQITREVQQDLMAMRMVPFATISDRLYRVTRLSAKENEKRVGLDIVGEQVEVDRGVMDRIAAPIEHLLRNAIVHGIEAPRRRVEIGKPEAGALKLEVRQEGNEVVLTLSDDGDGLNIQRIRDKAISLGMMREDEPLSDQQIGNFIFRSGFSTAGAVTAEAGRGVGMDVVMAEVTALGGRVGTQSERGKGTQFTIQLPLTLSVLQAVVMRLAGNYFAVPTMMVEQVQRLKADVLAAAAAAREIEWQGMRYPFHHLAKLLDTDAADETQRYGSVLLLRSAQQRAAIQVDDIIGGQEIVIKNIGPQLARVPGITGAAVLGSGETVLILNPVMLTTRYLETAALAQEAKPAPDALQPAESSPDVPPPEPQAPAEPERPRNVLVVDDSLTVRKITDRLLTREGYRVAVAKDGLEALEKLRDQLPDVMITDVEMPRMDGFDLVRNVRTDDSLKALPIIMITSRTADKHRQHAAEIGVDVFLGKPYEEGELLGHIATLAKRAIAG